MVSCLIIVFLLNDITLLVTFFKSHFCILIKFIKVTHILKINVEFTCVRKGVELIGGTECKQ